MSVEASSRDIKISIETHTLHPHQTILGFTLEALKRRVAGSELESEVVAFRNEPTRMLHLCEALTLMQSQAAQRLIEIAPLTADDEAEEVLDKIAAREAALYELPSNLSRVARTIGHIWVDINGKNQTAINSATYDAEIMRSSSIYVTGDIPTQADNPEWGR